MVQKRPTKLLSAERAGHAVQKTSMHPESVSVSLQKKGHTCAAPFPRTPARLTAQTPLPETQCLVVMSLHLHSRAARICTNLWSFPRPPSNMQDNFMQGAFAQISSHASMGQGVEERAWCMVSERAIFRLFRKDLRHLCQTHGQESTSSKKTCILQQTCILPRLPAATT